MTDVRGGTVRPATPARSASTALRKPDGEVHLRELLDAIWMEPEGLHVETFVDVDITIVEVCPARILPAHRLCKFKAGPGELLQIGPSTTRTPHDEGDLAAFVTSMYPKMGQTHRG